MLSQEQSQALATQFFEDKTAMGHDMSGWRVLRANAADMSPKHLVLLAKHTGEELGTLFNHGIGVNNTIQQLMQVVEIDEFGAIYLKREPFGVAA